MDVTKEICFFDRFADAHGDYDVLAERSYKRLLEVMAEQIRPLPGMRCVDLGCGTGAFTRRLGQFGFVRTGVDISLRSVEQARKLGGAEYVQGDICDCALPSESFDVAVMSGVLHHIDSDAVRIKSLQEALRLLKPGGHFFSYDPNGHSPSMFLYRDPRSPFCSQRGKTENEILLTRRPLEAQLARAGFTNIRVAGLSGIAYRYVEGRLARKLLPLYNRVYEPLIRWWPFEKALGTFLVATGAKPGPATPLPARP